MIEYDPNKWYGFHKLIQLEGSVSLRVMPHCLIAALLVIVVNTQDLSYFPSKPYGHQIFTYGMSFLVIMRTNLSYSRYWEGITACITMHSKWLDAAAQIIAFDELSIGPAATSGHKFRKHVVHVFGLMSATAMLELQGEGPDKLREVVQQYTRPGQPKVHFGSVGLKQSAIRPSSPASIAPLKQEEEEEGPTERDSQWLPVIGAVAESEFEEYLLAKSAGVPVHYWMQKMARLCTMRHHQGGLAAPPPIVSRIFQELSNGLLGFENANKITTIPFPFPYVQIVQYLQTAFVLSIPFVVVDFVDEIPMQMIFSFLAVFTFTALNAVAAELEDPFGHDANDLPLAELHTAFVMKISQLFYSELSAADQEALSLDEPEEFADKIRRGSLESLADECVQPSAELQRAHSEAELDVGVADMMRVMSQQVLGSHGTVSHEQALRSIFNGLDADNNGQLEDEECRQLCVQLGLTLTEEKFRYLMKKIDPSATGQVDFDSFWNWYERRHQKMQRKQATKSANHTTP